MSIIAKYKFDHNVYADLVPVFNAEFTTYNVTDEVATDGSYTIRTIESDDLPTLMRFGRVWKEGELTTDNRTDSLLEILDITTDNLEDCASMFRYNVNLTKITCNWNTLKATSMSMMFASCYSLVNIDLFNFNTSNVTNMNGMFWGSALSNLDISKWDMSKIITMQNMFRQCTNLTVLDISKLDTSGITSSNDIFTNTSNIKYIKCNIPSTIQILSSQLPTRTSDDPGTIIYQGAETLSSDLITELQAKGWNVVTSPQLIAEYKYDSKIYKNLIPVFNEGYMGFITDTNVDANGIVTRKIEHVELPTKIQFGVVNLDASNRELCLLEIIKLETKGLTQAGHMFRTCRNLSIIHGVSTWDVSKIDNMTSMFGGGCGIVSLDLSNWNTSNVESYDAMFSNDRQLTTLKMFKIGKSTTSLTNMFKNCSALSELDLSMWETKNVQSIKALFYGTYLSKLDISNFNISNTMNCADMFYSVQSLTDIGMIYCNKDTVNKVASLLPTDHNVTIWVESDDILQYDQYDHITYKTQKVQDTVHLNSPLLMGDTIEVIDGKTYHVHRYEKVVLDGSEDYSIYLGTTNGGWTEYSDTKVFYYSYSAFPNVAPFESLFCDRLLYVNKISLVNEKGISNITWGGDQNSTGQNGHIAFRLMNNELSDFTKEGFKQWLSENPTTVIYKLKTPYYELISEDPLELTLLDTTDNTINNNSILPSNMTIANKELSTIAIKPSTTYTLAFDKSIPTSNITIDICGSSQVTTAENMITLTTPSELGSGIRFLSSDGCIVSNVRLLEGSLVESAIPKESFEGLQSSFDDGYIIGENLLGELHSATNDYIDNGDYYTLNLPSNASHQGIMLYKLNNIKKNTKYTIMYKVDIIEGIPHICFMNNNNTSNSTSELVKTKSGVYIETLITNNTEIGFLRILNRNGLNSHFNIYKNIIVLEGDHTHLSEAELMRYIEKGTSHYEEEDYNHVGKYKVEYKVTGKNKININDLYNKNNLILDYAGQGFYIYPLKVEKNKDYFISVGANSLITNDKGISPYLLIGNTSNYDNCTSKFWINHGDLGFKKKGKIKSSEEYIYVFLSSNMDYIRFILDNIGYIQIEEGTVATEYEPYKEDIKTYYLSSPLLEGDTIEDVNGVATHIKRYEKVVLDGDEYWSENTHWSTDTIKQFYTLRFPRKPQTEVLSDKFTYASNTIQAGYECIGSADDTAAIYIAISSLKLSTRDINGFTQYLKQNPTTVVYQLASPIYKPISTESILCDSYVGGHLDLDSDIPVEKVRFREPSMNLKYLQPNTNYTIQFESDNVGKIDSYFYMNGRYNNINVVKGVNKFDMTTLSTIEQPILYFDGIGFNASNIQVIANATHENGDVKEFDYFKGLQSSFEDGLVTDENDEHYGQYAVDVKVVGKNKVDLKNAFSCRVDSWTNTKLSYDRKTGDIIVNENTLTFNNTNSHYAFVVLPCDFRKGKTYHVCDRWSSGTVLSLFTEIGTLQSQTVPMGTFTFTAENDYKFVAFQIITSTPTISWSNIRIVEGTEEVSYEPYKESSYTIYLNSPLLKDDTIEVVDGKLSHVHRYCMVTLDGSENNENYYLTSAVTNNINTLSFLVHMYNDENINKKTTNNVICDIFYTPPNLSFDYANNDNVEMIESWLDSSASFIININKSKLPTSNLNGFKQWLQANPTTVVYELATPTVENIEPIQSGFVLSSVKEGDMTIDTALPIKVDLEYRTNMAGTSALEEQLANVQNGADLIDIINSEVDE